MKVTFDNVYNAFQIIAPKGTMISFTGEPTALADGVYLVGDDGIINLDEQFLTDTLYLSTEGTDYAVTGGMRVTYPLGDETVIIRAGSSTIPFSKGGKGGGGSGGDNTHYKGTTTTPISNGSMTNPITIDGESYTAVFGDIVVYNYTEYVFDGTQWSEIGRPFDTTPTSGSANAVTSDGIYKRTPWVRTNQNGATSGEFCTATSAAVAAGRYANASAYYTAAFGESLVANQRAMTAVGKWNKARTGDLFNVGNGTGTANQSNILEVNQTELNVNGEIKKNGVSLPTPYTTMPTITAEMLGQIAQYVGETTNDYVKGYFYIASSDGAAEPTYSWVSMVDDTPTSGSKNFVTSDGIYRRTPLGRGTGTESAVGGRNSVAGGNYTFAFGDGLSSNRDYLASFGRYNNPFSGALFTIGNGTSTSKRSNIVSVTLSAINIGGDIKRDGVGIDDYTTTERKIGKWIDGSDLYQRTFEVTGLVNGQWNTSVLGTSGINIVDVQGWIDWTYNSEPNCRTDLNYYANSHDYVSLANTYNDLDVKPNRTDETGMLITEAVITIKYTKPSAQANLMQASAPPAEEEVSETPTTTEEDDMR